MQPMKFYGDRSEESFNEGRAFIESAFRMWLRRDLTLDEKWELDELLERVYSREPNRAENKLLRKVINGHA